MKASRENRIKRMAELLEDLEGCITERGARVRIEREHERYSWRYGRGRRCGRWNGGIDGVMRGRRVKGVTETIGFLATSRRAKATRGALCKRS